MKFNICLAIMLANVSAEHDPSLLDAPNAYFAFDEFYRMLTSKESVDAANSIPKPGNYYTLCRSQIDCDR